MSSTQLVDDASVTIGVSGLSVACHNASFDNNRGRWEIAIPRFADHSLKLELTGLGTFAIEPQVKLIEIRALNSFVVDNPRNEPGAPPDRTQLPGGNGMDLRWLTNFETELGNEIVSAVKKSDNENRVALTMVHIFDAVGYTKSIDSSLLVRANQSTAPLDQDGRAQVTATPAVLQTLEQQATLFEARVMGLDIRSPEGSSVEITIDGGKLTVARANETRQILITNVESTDESNGSRFIDSANFHFGLGDLYRYYELFNVTGEKVHEWGKQPKGGGSGPNRQCCCNTTQINTPRLGD